MILSEQKHTLQLSTQKRGVFFLHASIEMEGFFINPLFSQGFRSIGISVGPRSMAEQRTRGALDILKKAGPGGGCSLQSLTDLDF